jgi:EAL domain-containing protein (putative c-di-GMP-specific phosphodiesterase class I)
MQVANDLLLILEPDPASQDVLNAVAGRLGCERVSTDSLKALHELLSARRPTIVVIAVDGVDGDFLAHFQTLAQHGARPATLLVGDVSSRVLAGAKRLAESRGLRVIGIAGRPLDGIAIEQLLTPFLMAAPPIPREELEQALVDHELFLLYQPKLIIASAVPKIQGVEALIRWQHPRRGLLQPRHFLGAVEEYDLMAPLTDFVMTEAVRQAGVWQTKGLGLEMVINLSPRLVRDRDFPERLATLLRESEFPPEQLTLDVTESTSSQDRSLMLDVFTRLRVLGVGLSLDNFGTGLSSLTELYRLPFSEIKVDHSLIADVVREREAQLIVQAIANLGHTLQLGVCAEGVETRQTLEFIRFIGFDTAQGRFFAEPAHGGEIERIVQAWPSSGPAATGSWQALKPIDFDSTSTAVRPMRAFKDDGQKTT